MPAIRENVDLLPYNTFRIKATARYFTSINSIKEAQSLFKSPLFTQQPKLFLGGGSNILFTHDFDGLVIQNCIKGITTLAEDENRIQLKVGAGENWHAFVMYCVERNYGGIENLSLIPGTTGAAPMQNIGAYGVETKDVIDEVEAIDLVTGGIRTFSNRACNFGYRESFFKHEGRNKYFISSITLTLTKRNHQFNTSYGAIKDTMTTLGIDTISIKGISDAVIHIRRSKLPDPAVIGNAGSFFKNPTIQKALYDTLKIRYPNIPGYSDNDGHVKVPAGWLIEQSGWKGKTFGNIGVHAHQALVLVNYGGGEGKKIWELAQQIQSSVQEKFQISLQAEVNII